MTPRSITDVKELEDLYGVPGAASIDKVATHLTPLYRKWIMSSRFCVLSTVGPEGTDASPRGDIGPVVTEHDPKTLLMPDWRGNNRMDSLRNIVRDGRVSLMFMVPQSNTIVRVNGKGRITTDTEIVSQFEQQGRNPRSVIIIEIEEVYTQCARALMRSELWSITDTPDLPSVGEILKEVSKGDFDAEGYEAGWSARAKETMW